MSAAGWEGLQGEGGGAKWWEVLQGGMGCCIGRAAE